MINQSDLGLAFVTGIIFVGVMAILIGIFAVYTKKAH